VTVQLTIKGQFLWKEVSCALSLGSTGVWCAHTCSGSLFSSLSLFNMFWGWGCESLLGINQSQHRADPHPLISSMWATYKLAI